MENSERRRGNRTPRISMARVDSGSLSRSQHRQLHTQGVDSSVRRRHPERENRSDCCTLHRWVNNFLID